MTCDELRAERVIFRTECQLLLSAVGGIAIGAVMIGDTKHPLWQQDAFQEAFARRLGASGEVCMSTVERID